MENFIKYLDKNNYAKSTINTYKSVLKKFMPLLHDIRLVKNKLLEIKNPNTAWTYYNVICSFFDHTKDTRIKLLQQIKLEKVPQIYRKELTKDEIYKNTKDLSDIKCVIVRFLFETGIRVAEFGNIFDIKQHTLKVRGKGNKVREVFHKSETTKLIKDIHASSKTITLWVKKIMGDDVTPHTLRRSHATHMLLSGANPKTVMMQLGHTKIETTYRYLQISKSAHKKIYDKYF